MPHRQAEKKIKSDRWRGNIEDELHHTPKRRCKVRRCQEITFPSLLPVKRHQNLKIPSFCRAFEKKKQQKLKQFVDRYLSRISRQHPRCKKYTSAIALGYHLTIRSREEK